MAPHACAFGCGTFPIAARLSAGKDLRARPGIEEVIDRRHRAVVQVRRRRPDAVQRRSLVAAVSRGVVGLAIESAFLREPALVVVRDGLARKGKVEPFWVRWQNCRMTPLATRFADTSCFRDPRGRHASRRGVGYRLRISPTTSVLTGTPSTCSGSASAATLSLRFTFNP
jgi:hypothetical protein